MPLAVIVVHSLKPARLAEFSDEDFQFLTIKFMFK